MALSYIACKLLEGKSHVSAAIHFCLFHSVLFTLHYTQQGPNHHCCVVTCLGTSKSLPMIHFDLHSFMDFFIQSVFYFLVFGGGGKAR